MESYCCDKCLLFEHNSSRLKVFWKNNETENKKIKKISLKTCGCEYHRLCFLEILDSYRVINWRNTYRLDKETNTYFINCYKCDKLIIDNIPVSHLSNERSLFSTTTLSNPENISSVLSKLAFDSLFTEINNKETVLFTHNDCVLGI
jgi:hypothetical protein